MSENLKIIKRAVKGDEQAFVQFMSLYKVDLYKTALAYLKSELEALEAIQEVTYRAYKNIRSLKEIKYAKTWLIRIMINYCIDQQKRNKRFILNENILNDVGIHDSHLTLELDQAMTHIDDRSREILTLIYFNGLKIKEVAKVMQRPEGTIKTWLNRALKLLRKQLDEKGGDTFV